MPTGHASSHRGLAFLARSLGRYRDVFGERQAVRFFVPGGIARIGVAMTGLAVLWAVQGATGSFAQAGVATGAFAVADAVVGPQVARLVDRRGQRRVLPVMIIIHACAGLGVIIATAQSWPLTVVVGIVAVLGASIPPVGALTAARWRTVIGSHHRISTALSAEGSLNDLAHLIGPVVVTTLSASIASWLGLAVAGSLILIGMTGVVTASASEPPAGGRASRALFDRRLVTRGFLALFAANVAMGFFFGGVGIALTAFSLAHGAGALTGVITGVSGIVSLGAGLGYGSFRAARPVPTMIIAATMITCGTALLAIVPSVPVMFAGYAVVGGCVALVLIPGSVLVQHAVPRTVLTQAMSWINSASAIGIATSAPLIGVVVQARGWRLGFVVLAGLTALVPIIVAVTRRALEIRLEGSATGQA